MYLKIQNDGKTVPTPVHERNLRTLIREMNLKRLFIGTFAVCGILILLRSNSSNKSIDLIPVSVEKFSLQEIPTILYWDSYFATQYKHFVPTKDSKIQCPYECIHTTNRSEYGDVAKIRVFHVRGYNPNDLPPNNPDALNVYYTLEPPYLTYSHFNDKLILSDYFNVTGSYRSNSEIYYPYDYFMPLNGEESKDDVWTDEQIEEKLDRKQKLALIAMSNCKAQSKRHKYVKELEKYMNISIVGKCYGNTKCDKGRRTMVRQGDNNCMNQLVENHYFYLAFENSVCPEYVTEKFWRLRELIVPIVLSRSIMPSYIPNDTYIAASDFSSPQDLADYLEYLTDNRDEYKKYFAWTKKYRKTQVKEEEIAASCQLCKLAYQNQKYQIKDYKKYWTSNECAIDYGLDLFKSSSGVQKKEQRLSDIMKNTSRPRSIGLIL